MDMRPLFDSQAVFSDESPQFRTPFQPKVGEDVTISIRVGVGQVDNIHIEIGKRRYLMTYSKTKGDFDYFTWTTHLGEERIYYRFELEVGTRIFYYTKLGLSKEHIEYADFLISPGYEVPRWLHGAVMYQIYTDRFKNGNPSNDVMTNEYYYLNAPVRHIDDWDAPPESMEVG
ncbi:MAG: alpha-glycosidase, partial [Lachnospiraceae bacterium]|nr:alpha-glycosidase [Candidatus Equihabitans merdae]